ncbi:chloramphenicol-biosynthetic FADH2-dependent halogenase CmlS [Rathayibacter tanaceti]|uniref:Chloramphenicol-biosynthetic FADH2-dependent halogenase CmlS n=2 Tax=Rathayibacter tanaceti TaxID=1671680 RepID=A0A162G0G7_9MICO|nr:chloramphenicol-biosynthetic FADH2-dependent halogenase CmlS [Rathayibacter tanaceti]KZX22300.1 putative FAD-dependent oxidoreductase LodB [Rathayibacter tanaceti]QHC56125.1 chloramphenicol-biosynthetic FADH2-dependent halogenase CmlS [Rathayibacter tanaceti]TCO36962.1 flavin-dependent dehydrogenase [Rathayibacter tanaceti]
MTESTVAIIGAGPGGAVAALTLTALGHKAVVYEKAPMPRYRVGESLLPGTLSVLQRLGLKERIDAAGFVTKPSATFLWGQGEVPWTFSFSAPQVQPWVYDHALQVLREDFDSLVVDEARARGVTVNVGTAVTDVDLGSPDSVTVHYRDADGPASAEYDFVIDAGGVGSPLARKLGVRRYDEYFKNFAVWNYYRMADPFENDLKGTTYTISFEDGWVWMIPLKGDLYSVGLVVDRSKNEEVRELGPDEFFRRHIRKADRAMALLGDSEIVGETRIVHDWSYDSETFSAGRYFLSGDAAAFTDPMFSQGIHLAVQSAVSAASAIDRISGNPPERDAVHAWYNRSYRDVYEQYHEFLSSFYTFASYTEPDSVFWRQRRVEESDDERFDRMRWFERITGEARAASRPVADFRDRAAAMIEIGRHQRGHLSDEFADDELNPARVRWVSQLTRQLHRIAAFEWTGEQVALKEHYAIDPLTFELRPVLVLADETGRDMVKWPISPEQLPLFERVASEGIGYRELLADLNSAGMNEISSQVIIRLMEAGLLRGRDRHGERVVVQDRLRFGGVGVEYDV